MKKAVVLSVLGVLLLAAKSEAQRFVTSFGVEQHWSVPYEVHHALEHQYWGYDWVHASMVQDRRSVHFEVVLQRGDVFVLARVAPQGRIVSVQVDHHYPLAHHICSNHCGFHDAYYAQHVMYCSSHQHYGHNHVAYRRQPHPRIYVSTGHPHGHYKKGNGKHSQPAIQEDPYVHRGNASKSRLNAQVAPRSRQDYTREVDTDRYDRSDNYPSRRTD